MEGIRATKDTHIHTFSPLSAPRLDLHNKIATIDVHFTTEQIAAGLKKPQRWRELR